LRSYSADPEQAHATFKEKLDALQAAWKDFFEKQQAAPEAMDLVQKREFSRAAEELLKAGKGTLLGGGKVAGTEPRSRIALIRRMAGAGGSVFAGERMAVLPREPVAGPVVIPLRWEEGLLKFLRALILGALLVGYYWMAASPTFTGMWTDAWNAFLMAFAADLAVDGIYAKLKPKGG
jgi:hypothetical protein